MEKEIRILYAEDNVAAAMIYSEILKESGFTPRIAKDGNEAWELYQQEPWDLILLDMDLPGKNGLDIIRLIRDKGDLIPIVILSSQNHNHALYEGADDYLVKGCDVDDVKARLDKALARTRQLNTEKEQGLFHISPFTTFNKSNHKLVVRSQKEILKTTESKILWSFCLRVNETIPTVEICENLWGMHSTEKERSLTRYVCLLRKKLLADTTIALVNEFAAGYKLVNNL